VPCRYSIHDPFRHKENLARLTLSDAFLTCRSAKSVHNGKKLGDFLNVERFADLRDNETFRRVFKRATSSSSTFSMSANQYKFIADQLLSSKGCNFLVFGGGNDTELWLHCCDGNMTLVESDPEWMPAVPCKTFRPRYRGRIGTWVEVLKMPAEIQQAWDFCLVDGPTGYAPQCIGRQEPIAWAARVAKTIFVHDYNRPWERELCDHYLGKPEKLIPFAPNHRGGTLAVFSRPKRHLSVVKPPTPEP
jgi:hypothetical protein